MTDYESSKDHQGHDHKNEEVNSSVEENTCEISNSPYDNELSNVFQNNSSEYANIANELFEKISDGDNI